MKTIVIKIGGSTLGNSDTTVEDLVMLQKRGIPMVVVHGGAQTVSDWLGRLGISTSFIRGLRVTDLESLRVVTAILAGLVNKELVSAIWRLGGKAIGLSGADGGLIQARNKTPDLGYTGEELEIDAALLDILLKTGYIPVVAPISLSLSEKLRQDTNLLNVNGDTAAGEIAAALNAEKLIFLTDVPGLYDSSKNLVHRLSLDDAKALVASGTASGGMATKIDACLRALTKVRLSRIIDGRIPHALIDEIEGEGNGTTIA
ncbi:MAG TPA: acetylglutamate kinase [Dehalococcoidia bacterium]|nr:acetylglutamate kinase [Dehalococcoidia bacterium]